MDNPCKECIVASMCQIPCDDLKTYINKHLKKNRSISYDDAMLNNLSIVFRQGGLRLAQNEWGYYLKEEKEYYEKSV